MAAVSLNLSSLLIKRRLARRACFPAAVDPQPLVRILADEVFYYSRKFCSICYGVGLIIAGANQLYGWGEAQNVFFLG
jgi:hypothetical protein